MTNTNFDVLPLFGFENPCTTLADMPEPRVRELEAVYGCRVKRVRYEFGLAR